MGDEDRRDMYLVVQPPQPSSQLFADIGIQGAERLVQQQHAGLDREGASQRHALPLTTGKLSRQSVGELRQMHQSE